MPLFNPGIDANGGAIAGALSVGGDLATSGALTVTGAAAFSGAVQVATAGQTIGIKEGTNACMGTAVLNGTTEVVVATTAVQTNSRIYLTANTPGGVPTGSAYVSSRSAGVQFGIKGLAGDTSTVAWLILAPL